MGMHCLNHERLRNRKLTATAVVCIQQFLFFKKFNEMTSRVDPYQAAKQAQSDVGIPCLSYL